MGKKRLLDYAFAAGCAGKACQADLFAILKGISRFTHPDLLVGPEGFDDAGVYRLDNKRALVLTVDVLTPIADDPLIFGEIAAANSLSDVYAMGGSPLVALSVLGFPVSEIGHKTIRAIIAGATRKVREANAVIAGGHTFKDMEVKLGLAVIGTVHPQGVVTNGNAQPGDVLILTKPIGTGIITTALKANRASAKQVDAANGQMRRLNKTAAEVMVKTGVNAATDVTGFGLLGHAWEMAQASRVDIIILSPMVPLLEGVLELAEKGFFPLGSLNNYEFIKNRAVFPKDLSEDMRLVLCDAQTSGGLLISVPKNRAQLLLDHLWEKGVTAARMVGYVANGKGMVVVE
ncbi:MAG: selenide, water dikinase SelD [candidate division WOR-3 bacterium]